MIVGLVGYARSGKDTVGRVLVEEAGFARLAFADKLKELARELNPYMGMDEHRPRFLDEIPDTHDPKKWPEYRDFLVRLGRGARDILGEDVWVDQVMDQTEQGKDYVITDVRYPNEARQILERGGDIWYVCRGLQPANREEGRSVLEVLQGYPTTFIDNSGTVDDLRKEVLFQASMLIELGV